MHMYDGISSHNPQFPSTTCVLKKATRHLNDAIYLYLLSFHHSSWSPSYKDAINYNKNFGIPFFLCSHPRLDFFHWLFTSRLLIAIFLCCTSS